ncbi:MAG: hypothetical protein GC160_18165 [Acidobacteria bacterium]|nr:hypothetical protein [Acidobacteriota bacterium]
MKSQTFLSSALIAVATVAVVAASVGPDRRPEPLPGPAAERPAGPNCDSPVVAAFDEISVRALEISEIAEAAPAPLEDSPETAIVARQTLKDLSQRARALDSMTAQALQPGAPLEPTERLLAQSLSVHSARLTNLAAQAQSTLADDGEFDAAALVRQLDAMAVQGWEMARLVTDASLCSPYPSVSEAYAPTPRCETLDPEYEMAMFGVCSY